MDVFCLFSPFFSNNFLESIYCFLISVFVCKITYNNIIPTNNARLAYLIRIIIVFLQKMNQLWLGIILHLFLPEYC